jgi:predicted nucleic acid-binding protein
MIVIDTDILSMFAKVDAIDALKKLFKDCIVMTPKIRDEISIPLEYGYTFPLNVISKIGTVPLSPSALKEYERLSENWTLGKGELEAISYCKTENGIFLTNDKKARELAKNKGVRVISLQAILRALWKTGIKTKEETTKILERIKEIDNLYISPESESEIFKE